MAYELEIEGEGEYTLELEREPEEYTLEVENEVVVAKGGDTPTVSGAIVFDDDGNVTGTIVNVPYAYFSCKSYNSGYPASALCLSTKTIKFEKVESVESYAFQYCSALTSIDLPACTSVGTYVFYNCSKLTSLILRNTEKVATLSSISAFSSTPISDGTGYIYVPDALVDSYKTATNWATYADQIKPLSELPAEA